MDSLYQRLKELDADTFQRVCFQLISERHPGAGIRHVEGASGDEGLDLFQGELESGPTIWQCKAFPNGVGESQKQQIRDSFSTALEKFSPRHWILCLSVDMDSKAYRWFGRYKKTYASQVQVGLFSASDIVHELIHRRSIRNHFFPGAAIDATELKRIVSRSGELTQEQLERITANNLEDYIERLKERDARFNYEIVYSGDLGTNAPPSRPGLMMSLNTGAKTVNVYPRDAEALRQDPPRLSLRFSGSGVQKMQELLRTGKPQQFDSTEVNTISTTWPLMDDVAFTQQRLTLGPSESLSRKRLRMSGVFSGNGGRVEYTYLEFAPTRVGIEEVELETTNETLPFRMTLALPLLRGNRSATFGFLQRFPGYGIAEVEKFLRASDLVKNNGEITLTELERGKLFLRANGTSTAGGEDDSELLQLVSRLNRVSEAFGAELKFPNLFTDEDFDALEILEAYLNRTPVSLDDISIVLQKSYENREAVLNTIDNGGVFRIESNFHYPPPKLLGVTVFTGPCVVSAPVKVKDKDKTRDEWMSAVIGDSVRVSMQPLAPVLFGLQDNKA